MGPTGYLNQNIEQLAGGYLRYFLIFSNDLFVIKIYFRFTQISPADVGNYTCTAENEAGRATGIANIIVNTYPELTIIPNEEVLTVDEGNYVRLECRGDGIPRPIVQWLRPEQNSL